MDNMIKENFNSLIDNFERDMRKSGKFDNTVEFFLLDLKGLLKEVDILFDKEYERGKDDGYEEGKSDSGIDENAVDDALDNLRKIEDLISNTIYSLDSGWG